MRDQYNNCTVHFHGHTPVESAGPIGSLSRLEIEALVDVMRYVAANENVGDSALESGLLKFANAPSIAAIARCEFPQAVRRIVRLGSFPDG